MDLSTKLQPASADINLKEFTGVNQVFSVIYTSDDSEMKVPNNHFDKDKRWKAELPPCKNHKIQYLLLLIVFICNNSITELL